MEDFKNHYDCCILIGQTNLATTNWCILKGHCVSAGIMCAELPFCFFHLYPACFKFSYAPTLPCAPLNNTQTTRRERCIHMWRQREQHTVVIAVAAARKSDLPVMKTQVAHLIVNGHWFVAVLHYVVWYAGCCQCRNSISALSSMDSSMYDC